MKMKWGTLLRAAVTVAFLLVIVLGVDWARVGGLLGQTDVLFLVLSIALNAVLALVSAWKWSILLQASGHRIPLLRLFQLYLVGYFFNHVLPSTVGGDVVRAYEVGRGIDDGPAALASVFVERFTGLTALILLATISLVSNLSLFQNRWFAIAVGAAIVGYLVMLVMILREELLQWLRDRFATGRLGKLFARLQEQHRAIAEYADRPRVLVEAMLLSFAFYVLAVANVYLSSLAFGTHVSIISLVVIVPVILVISMMPISIGGFGVQEWAYYITFEAIGAGGSLGLLVALLIRVKNLGYGVVGGLSYPSGRPTAEELEEPELEEPELEVSG